MKGARTKLEKESSMARMNNDVTVIVAKDVKSATIIISSYSIVRYVNKSIHDINMSINNIIQMPELRSEIFHNQFLCNNYVCVFPSQPTTTQLLTRNSVVKQSRQRST